MAVGNCLTCHQPIAQKPGPGRPRTYHEGCKPKRGQRPALRLATEPGPRQVAGQQVAGPATPPDPLSLEAATLADLQAVDRHGTTRGIAALRLARLLDAGDYNAQGAAALVKAHREALDLAMEGTTPEADVIDVIFGESG